MGRFERREYKGYWIAVLEEELHKGDIDYSVYSASIENDQYEQLAQTGWRATSQEAEELAEYLVDTGRIGK